MSQTNPIILGEHEIHRRPFGLDAGDFRHHLYIVGKTGSGKTTLLKNILIQKIQAGEGVGLIDPHGDLAEELLRFIPDERKDDLVYFFPGDLEFPVAFNLLAPVPPDRRPLVAQGIVSAFRSIWSDSWGPRMEHILYHALATLLDCENVSLLALPRILVDPGFRRWAVNQVQDPAVRFFWEEEFGRYDPRFAREAVSPILNKIGQFLGLPAVRNVLGQVRKKIEPREIMDDGRIFIANLSKGQIGAEAANLLGSLLTAQFQLAAMGRAEVEEGERRDFTLVLDEFQNFGTDVFASLLSEARKYRLSLVLSHQFAAQLKPAISDAVFGNVGTVIAFRVGHADAELLSDACAEEYLPSQFVDLSRFQVIARLQQRGESQPAFMGRTLDSNFEPASLHDSVMARSRAHYATPRNEVEARVNRWFERRF